ncbi:MAG: hypothetical protein ABL949_08315 [Fimbriimonadaceae bacterium]
MYFVIGSDGSEYGPASIQQLQAWVTENRVTPLTMLKDANTGERTKAGSLMELFPSNPVFAPDSGPAKQDPYEANPYGQNYQNPYAATPVKMQDESFPWGSIIRSVAAVAVFFLLQGLGFIFGIYALVTAIQCQLSGNKYGPLAIIVAVIALGVVALGWFMRSQGAPV